MTTPWPKRTVYAPCYDNDNNLKCIVRVYMGSGVAAISQRLIHHFDGLLASQRHWSAGHYYRVGKIMTSAEAETLIEMKVCDLVDMTKLGDELMPVQGWRDGTVTP